MAKNPCPRKLPHGYGWGTHVYYAIRNVKTAVAGSIIQFEKCTIKTGNVTSNVPHHTAIVESVNGSKVTVLHQNSNGNRTVQRKTYDFAGLQSGGSLRVYLPIPK